MQRAEYHAIILDNGQIPLPEEIRNQLRLKPDQEIRVVIEVPAPAIAISGLTIIELVSGRSVVSNSDRRRGLMRTARMVYIYKKRRL